MVHQWVTKGSIDNARRPGRGSMMRPTINEESEMEMKIINRLRCVSCAHLSPTEFNCQEF